MDTIENEKCSNIYYTLCKINIHRSIFMIIFVCTYS